MAGKLIQVTGQYTNSPAFGKWRVLITVPDVYASHPDVCVCVCVCVCVFLLTVLHAQWWCDMSCQSVVVG